MSEENMFDGEINGIKQYKSEYPDEYTLVWTIAYVLEIKFTHIQNIIHQIKHKYDIYRFDAKYYDELIELAKKIDINNPLNSKLDEIEKPIKIIYEGY